jgi:hypothetical protein
MTLARFEALLDAYGAVPERWPSSERDAAELLLQTDPAAQRVVAAAVQFDTLLDAYEVAEVSPRVRARVLEVPVVAARTRRKFGFRVAWAIAFSCVIGIASGALTAPEASADDDEWAELTEVSFYSDVDDTGADTTVEDEL